MAVSYRLQSLKERSISKVALEVMQAMHTKTDNPPAPGEAMSPGKRPDTSGGGGDGKEGSLAASHEADRDPRPIEIEEENPHFEPRPKLKVSKTVATMAPVTDLLVEYFEAAMAVSVAHRPSLVMCALDDPFLRYWDCSISSSLMYRVAPPS